MFESAVAVEDDRRVFCKMGTIDSSLAVLSIEETEVVKGEVMCTRWAVGMRVRKLLTGEDIFSFWINE